MFDFPERRFSFGGDSLHSHLNDKIGNVFKIGMIGYKVVNIQKRSVTFKNLQTGKNTVWDK